MKSFTPFARQSETPPHPSTRVPFEIALDLGLDLGAIGQEVRSHQAAMNDIHGRRSDELGDEQIGRVVIDF